MCFFSWAFYGFCLLFKQVVFLKGPLGIFVWLLKQIQVLLSLFALCFWGYGSCSLFACFFGANIFLFVFCLLGTGVAGFVFFGWVFW